MTPNFAIIQIETPDWHTSPKGWRLWIPLFLLWIPAVLLAPLWLLLLLAFCFLGQVNFWRSLSVFWGILSSLPGTDIRVQADQNRILIKIL
jgi:hypothetical protein